VRYPYGSALTGRSTPSTLALLERAFRDRFPGLGAVKVAHYWGGWIAMTLHFLPVLGRSGARHNIFHAIGYNGHGIAAATAMGPILADFMLGRPNEYAETLSRFVPPLPPEPLRWLLVRGVLGLLNYVDARVDRQVRRSGVPGIQTTNSSR
jgi:glycine/D-amino acid oxidase-like deaminating enzyme